MVRNVDGVNRLTSLLERLSWSFSAGLVLWSLACPALCQTKLDNVEIQIQRLKSPNLELRQYAADALAKFEDRRAVVPLIAALHDPDPKVRSEAASGLGRLKDLRAVEPLTAQLSDTDETVQIAVELALGNLRDPRNIPALITAMRKQRVVILDEFGTAAIVPLLAVLKDPDPAMRRNAAEILGEIKEGRGDPRVASGLRAALKDADAEVRQRALLSLSLTSDPTRGKEIEDALKDPDPAMRSTALTTISWMNSPEMSGAVIEALHDPDSGVRTEAARALQETHLHDARAVEPLIALLNDRTAKPLAEQALASLQNPRATDALIALATGAGSWDDRFQAVESLGAAGDPRVIDVLIALLHDSKAGLRTTACEQLGALRDPKAIEALSAAAREPATGTCAIVSLGQIGPPATPAIVSLLRDPATQSTAILAAENLRGSEIASTLIELLKTTYPGSPQPYGGITDVRSDPAPVHPDSYLYLISALGRVGDPRAVPVLIDYMQHGPIGRDRVPGALASLGAASVESLIPLLHSTDEKTRELAATALGELAMADDKDTRAREALLTALPSRDLAILAGAYEFYVGVGDPKSEESLVLALERFGDQEMAEYFLNCGDVALEDAAIAWGQRRGFPVIQEVYGVVWGKMPKPANAGNLLSASSR